MSIIQALDKRPIPTRRRPPRRNYMAAEHNRLTASLVDQADFINNTLRYQLRTLRARSRHAVQNNPFARRFVSMVVNNVCGPNPFMLQGNIKNREGRLDRNANRKIEEIWKEWGKKGNCELTGRWNLAHTLRLCCRILATDGEFLLRRHVGRQYGDFGYQIEIIDVDRLDEQKNAKLSNGGAINMGIELSPESKPMAYHILKRKPKSYDTGGFPREYERIPADQITHIYVPDHAEQVRGVPWMYAALLNLVHLGAYEEAAVINARVGAAKMGFFESPDTGAGFVGDTDKDEADQPQIEAEPGTFHFLPPGYKAQSWSPTYPTEAFESFVRAALQGVAAGLDVAYHNLAGDMKGVNYSSARIAELDERDTWKTLQSFYVDMFLQPELYDEWLVTQALFENLKIDASKINKYKSVIWQPRRWEWVDPQKESKAAIDSINARLKSRTQVAAESGRDIEDVFSEIEQENLLAADHNITLPDGKDGQTNQTENQTGDQGTDTGGQDTGSESD